MVSKLQWAVFPAGLSLLYSSSIDLKKYIFALSPSLSATDLQGLSKSLFVRWHFGLVGRGGNLLTSHFRKDREDFTTTKGHFNDLMCAAGWQLLTQLELIQDRLPPGHKLTTSHLASRTSLVRHLNSVPMEQAIPGQEGALCSAQDASLLTRQDVAEVDRLWSTLEQIQALFKDIIEIGLNQSDLLLHTLGIRPRGHVWKTVIVPPFHQLKPEYAARFSAIPTMTAEEKNADWKKYLQSCILNELGASPDLSEYAQFIAIKERVQQSKTPWECLGLSEMDVIKQQVNEQYRKAQLVVHPDKAGTMYPHTASQAAAALACALTRAKELCLPKGSRRDPSEPEA
jgi:hypothetical protein